MKRKVFTLGGDWCEPGWAVGAPRQISRLGILLTALLIPVLLGWVYAGVLGLQTAWVWVLGLVVLVVARTVVAGREATSILERKDRPGDAP